MTLTDRTELKIQQAPLLSEHRAAPQHLPPGREHGDKCQHLPQDIPAGGTSTAPVTEKQLLSTPLSPGLPRQYLSL